MVMLHALYTTVNILSGSEAHKDAVLCGNLPSLLLHHIRAPAEASTRETAPSVETESVQLLASPDPLSSLAARLPRSLKDTLMTQRGGSAESAEQDVLVLPAVWCVINLTWPDAGGSGAGRARKLKELGMEEGLRGLTGHASADVRERVRTALEQLNI